MPEADEPDRPERVAAALAVHRRDTPRAYAVGAACAVAVVGLLLPWSSDDGSAEYTRDAFGRSGWPVLLGLGTVGTVGVLTALYRSRPDPGVLTALRWLSAIGALVAAVSTLATTAGHQDGNAVGQGESVLAGPGTFVLGLLAATLLTHGLGHGKPTRANRPYASVWWRVTGGLLAAIGLTSAVAGIFAPWERLRSPALEALSDADSTVWTGIELPATTALRWALLATAGLVLLALPADRLRRVVVPVALLGGGAAVVVLSVPGATLATVRGVNASLGRDVGPVLSLAGGALCVVAGALTLAPGTWRGRARTGAVAAVPLALVGLLVAGHRPDRASAVSSAVTTPVPIFERSAGTSRLGARVLDIDVDQAPDVRLDDRFGLPNAVSTPAGLFFTVQVYDDEYLIEQSVHGRALPVTLVQNADDVTLLDVHDGRALLAVQDGSSSGIVSADLHDGRAFASAVTQPVPAADLQTGLLLTTNLSGQNEPGRLAVKQFTAQRAPDGGVLLVDVAGERAFRVSPAVARGRGLWRPRQVAYADFAGSGSTSYVRTGGEISVLDAYGQPRPFVGGVSDPRCTPSLDPLSSDLGNRFVAAVPSVDTAGDVWFLLSGAKSGSYDVYVRAADGTLRRLGGAAGHDVRGVQAMPDGSLVTQQAFGDRRDDRDGTTYRIPSAAAAARAATPLGAVPADCVSDNRVHVTSLGRAVRRIDLPALPRTDEDTDRPESVVVDPSGARAYFGSTDYQNPRAVFLARPGAAARSVRRVPEGTELAGLAADGRGGAWWSETTGSSGSPSTLWHVTAAGRARAVTRLRPGQFESNATTGVVADTGDGSVWTQGDAGRPWTRTTLAGVSRRLAYTGPDPSLLDGRGYAVGEDRVTLNAVSTAAASPQVLGGDRDALLLPSAAAVHAKPSRILPTGQVAATPGSGFVVHQGRYLARVTRAGAITFLATAASGLPDSPDRYSRPTEYVTGHTLVIYDGDRTAWTVDVS